jgi:hypothetical protein
MRLENFNKQEITWEQSSLLPDGIDIWVHENQEEWVSIHGDLLILTIAREIFCEEDNETRPMGMQEFILTPKN